MSLKNYIFASINTKSTSSYRNHHAHAQQIGTTNTSLNNNNESPLRRTGDQMPPHARGHNNDIMPTVAEEHNHGYSEDDDDDDDDPRSHTSMGWIRKVWKFISVEPVMIAWILPSCLLYIAIENLALEKVIVKVKVCSKKKRLQRNIHKS